MIRLHRIYFYLYCYEFQKKHGNWFQTIQTQFLLLKLDRLLQSLQFVRPIWILWQLKLHFRNVLPFIWFSWKCKPFGTSILVLRLELMVNLIINGIIKMFAIVFKNRVSVNVSQKANQNPAINNIAVEIRVEFLGTDCSKFWVSSLELIHGISWHPWEASLIS